MATGEVSCYNWHSPTPYAPQLWVVSSFRPLVCEDGLVLRFVCHNSYPGQMLSDVSGGGDTCAT